MASPVAQAVAESLGLSPDQGQKIVRHLAQHIRSQVSSARAVHVPDLGTFYLEGEHLAFRPDPALDDLVGASSARPVPIIFSHEPQGRTAWLKIAAVVFGGALIGAGGYWGFTRWQSTPRPVATDPVIHEDTIRIDIDVPGLSAEDLQVTFETVPVLDEALEETQPSVDDPAPAEPIPVDPPADSGSFVLVVASLVDDSAAQAVAADFRSQLENIPVEIVTFDNGRRYRITVGQADSYEGITQLRRQLSGLPEDTWVLELE